MKLHTLNAGVLARVKYSEPYGEKKLEENFEIARDCAQKKNGKRN
jgi:hypothetical protein